MHAQVRARPFAGTAWTPYWKLKMRPMLSTSRSWFFDQAGAFKSALEAPTLPVDGEPFGKVQGCDRDELERENLLNWKPHTRCPGHRTRRVSTSHRGNEETRLLLNETRFAYSRYTEPFMTSSLRYSAMTAILSCAKAAASGCNTTDTSVTYSYDPSFLSGPNVRVG